MAKRLVGLLLGLVVVLAFGGYIVLSRAPSVPADAGSSVVMEAVLAGPAQPDQSPDPDPNAFRPPVGIGCTTVTRPAGSLYLCWVATQVVEEADPDQDYYILRVKGSLNDHSGSGVRWLAVSARLTSAPSNNVFNGWPDGEVVGPCREIPVDLIVTTRATASVCGRTVGTSDASRWSHTVVWSCPDCLLPTTDAVGIVLYEASTTAEGVLPGWVIGADFGG